MEKGKLLIAEGNSQLRETLEDLFRGSYRICCCDNGYEAQRQITRFQPDILVLDVMLPGIDGISLLQWALGEGISLRVLLTTRLPSEYVLEAATRLGVGYVMLKPYDLGALTARVEDLSHSLRKEIPAFREPEDRISALLLTLGFQPKLRGFACLREAILLSARGEYVSVTKVLYPEVARRFGCKGSHVERNIRSAIDAAWACRDDAIWRLYFTADSHGNIPRPTNAAFISRLADGLRGKVAM